MKLINLLRGISAAFQVYSKANTNVQQLANCFASFFSAELSFLNEVSVTLPLLRVSNSVVPNSNSIDFATVIHPLRFGYSTNYRACFCRSQCWDNSFSSSSYNPPALETICSRLAHNFSPNCTPISFAAKYLSLDCSARMEEKNYNLIESVQYKKKKNQL